jgi:hypothetical protein
MTEQRSISRVALAAVLVTFVATMACRPTPPTPKEPAAAPTQAAGQAAPAKAEPAAADPRQAAPTSAPNTAIKTGGVLVVAHREDPPASWDPMFQTSISLAHVSASVFGDGNLVKPCRDDLYKVCPAIAESWTTCSGTTARS